MPSLTARVLAPNSDKLAVDLVLFQNNDDIFTVKFHSMVSFSNEHHPEHLCSDGLQGKRHEQV